MAQLIFQVHSRKRWESVAYNHPIGRKNTGYIPGIYCLLGDYGIPTTYYQNQNNSMKELSEDFSGHLRFQDQTPLVDARLK